jgi:hypothetical protein
MAGPTDILGSLWPRLVVRLCMCPLRDLQTMAIPLKLLGVELISITHYVGWLVRWLVLWLVCPSVGWFVRPSVPISLRKLITSQLFRAWGLVTTLFVNVLLQFEASLENWPTQQPTFDVGLSIRPSGRGRLSHIYE